MSTWKCFVLSKSEGSFQNFFTKGIFYQRSSLTVIVTVILMVILMVILTVILIIKLTVILDDLYLSFTSLVWEFELEKKLFGGWVHNQIQTLALAHL